MKSKIIAIGGNIGAGKDTITRLLIERLGYEKLSTGKFFRDEAAERGMAFEDFQKMLKEDADRSFDKKIDDKVREYVDDFIKENSNYLQNKDIGEVEISKEKRDTGLILISRVPTYVAPDAFKIFLKLDERVAAERIYNDLKVNPERLVEAHVSSVEEVLENNKKRNESERVRYLDLYGIDNTDLKIYDKVYDTETDSPEMIAEKILKDYELWLCKERVSIYIDGNNLYRAADSLGHKINYQSFFVWLKNKYDTKDIYLFLGYIKDMEPFYVHLKDCGFSLVFKETTSVDGKVKGNCDAELVLKTTSDFYLSKFSKAILVTSDGDFGCLVEFLLKENSFFELLSPAPKDKCSILLKKKTNKILYLDRVYKKFSKKVLA